MEDSVGAKWYVLQVMSGQENRVQKSLQLRCEADIQAGKMNGVLEVVIPSERVENRKNGKKIVRERKLYPGYLLIKLDLHDADGRVRPDTWSTVLEVQGVIGFIGKDRPVPISDEEVAVMMQQVEQAAEKPKPKIVYTIGETVVIKEGPFENFEGVIESVDTDRQRLKVSVSIFGRSTPVEVETWQVERPS